MGRDGQKGKEGKEAGKDGEEEDRWQGGPRKLALLQELLKRKGCRPAGQEVFSPQVVSLELFTTGVPPGSFALCWADFKVPVRH